MAGPKSPGDQAWQIGFDEGWYWATAGTYQEAGEIDQSGWAAKDYPDQWHKGYDLGDEAGRLSLESGEPPAAGVVAKGENAGEPAVVASKSWVDGLIAIADAAGKIIGYGLATEDAPNMGAQAKAGSFNTPKAGGASSTMIIAGVAAAALLLYLTLSKKTK